MREKLLTPECEAYLGPVAVAQFVEAGWLASAPLTWTKRGLRAIGKGMGLWTGARQTLPYEAEPSRWGAAFWDGRRTRPAYPLQGARRG